MGQWELQVLDEDLLHVWATDVIGLLDLNNLEDLIVVLVEVVKVEFRLRTCTDLKRER